MDELRKEMQEIKKKLAEQEEERITIYPLILQESSASTDSIGCRRRMSPMAGRTYPRCFSTR